MSSTHGDHEYHTDAIYLISYSHICKDNHIKMAAVIVNFLIRKISA